LLGLHEAFGRKIPSEDTGTGDPRVCYEMKSLTIDPKAEQAPTRGFPTHKTLPEHLPLAKEVNVHPSKSGGENASLFFMGTAITIL
jgi:hypothetical protein